jgi:hypothetical protein
MTEPPELSRYDQVPLGLRIRPGQTETEDEPPARTFTYHLRPSRAGEASLPPISISSFDPGLSRFMTQATQSVPIRVVAVSTFDPATIDQGATFVREGGPVDGQSIAWILGATALVAALASLVLVRRRLRSRQLARESAARRYAAELARILASGHLLAGAVPDGSTDNAPSMGEPGSLDEHAARRVSDLLIHYLELGAARPPGALTPDEACQGVTRVSRSSELGAKAGQLMTSSDRVRYGVPCGDADASDVLEKARALFEALGKVKLSDTEGITAQPSKATG